MIRLACLTCAVVVAVAVAALTWARYVVQPSRGSDGYPLDDEPNTFAAMPSLVICGWPGCNWAIVGASESMGLAAYIRHVETCAARRG